jgi:hypothetical protein
MAYPDRPEGGSVLHWRESAVAHLRFNRMRFTGRGGVSILRIHLTRGVTRS